MSSAASENGEVIRVILRAFQILRCFEDRSRRLGNREIAKCCSLPRSTVSRIMLTLARIGHVTYLRHEQKYTLSPHAVAFDPSPLVESCEAVPPTGAEGSERQPSANVRVTDDQFAI
ncbi:helix-turn-helix domain-containing protein [Bradyrhizobium mercantei]|uniref:helix-turn-helix domain-containing protein n=1 Tax=Bradyrhizobium mercantei TaxID=1904807 RepID=UPI001FD9D486|nr:helix-turn-helix domain-containing protein [Bradyrhizobium mercantei]